MKPHLFWLPHLQAWCCGVRGTGLWLTCGDTPEQAYIGFMCNVYRV